MAITLSDFTAAANRMTEAQQEDRTLKLDDGRVKDVWHPTFSSTNRATMIAFRESLRAEFGSDAERVAMKLLSNDYKEGKPLTAYKVSQVVAAAKKEAAEIARKTALAEFISGIGMEDGKPLAGKVDAQGNLKPAFTLDSVIDEKLSHYPGPPLSDDERHAIKHRVASELLQGYTAPDNSMLARDAKNSAVLRQLLSPQYEGTLADKCRIIDKVGGGANAAFALPHLPQMRESQSQGEFTAETIWSASFNELLPQALVGADDKEFAKAFGERKDQAIQKYTESLPAQEKDALQRPVWNVTKESATETVNNEYCVSLEKLDAARRGEKIEGTLTATVPQHTGGPDEERYGRTLSESAGLNINNFTGAPVTISATTADGAEKSVPLGRQSMAARTWNVLRDIVQAENKEPGSSSFRPSGEGEADAARIAATWHQTEDLMAALGGSDPLPDVQKRAVLDAMSQNFHFVPRRLELAAGRVADPANTAYAMRLERQENGDVLVHHTIQRRAGPDAPFETSSGVTFRIDRDGVLDSGATYFVNASRV